MKRSLWVALAIIAIVVTFPGVNPPVTGYSWVTPYHQAIYFGGVQVGGTIYAQPNSAPDNDPTITADSSDSTITDDSPCDGSGNTIAPVAAELLVGDTSNNRCLRPIMKFSLAGLAGATLATATMSVYVFETRVNGVSDIASPLTNPGLGDLTVIHVGDYGAADVSDYQAGSTGNNPGVHLSGTATPDVGYVSINVRLAMQQDIDVSFSFTGYRLQMATATDNDGEFDQWKFRSTEFGTDPPKIDYTLAVTVRITLNAASGSQAITASNTFTVSYTGPDSTPKIETHTGSNPKTITDVYPSTTVTIDGTSSASSASERWVFRQDASSISFTSPSSGSPPAPTLDVTYVYYNQLKGTANINVNFGGSPSPTLTYTGAPNIEASADSPTSRALTLTASAQDFYANRGSTCSVDTPTLGNERWSTPTACTIGNTITFQYYHQYHHTVILQVSGGGNAFPAAGVTLTDSYHGASRTRDVCGSATSCSTVDWSDATTFTIAAEANGQPVGEKWRQEGDAAHSFTPSLGGSTTRNFYNQLSTTVSASVTFGGTPTTTLSYTYLGSVTPTSFGAAGGSTTVWMDRATSWSLTDPIPGAANERWACASGCSASAGTGAAGSYYHQYGFTLSYALSGTPPGAPSAPSFSSSRFGSAVSETLTASPIEYWFDAGSPWSVENPLAPSTSIERWFTSQSTSGIVTGPQTILFNYYHQFLETFRYAVVGGGSDLSAPTFTANQFGSPLARVLATTPTSEWFDAGSSWSVTNPLGGSTATERWATSQQTGTVVGSQTLVFNYYRQFLQALAYFVSASGSGYGAPTFTANRFGSSFGQVLTGTVTDYWFDAGSEWELTPMILPLSGYTTSERWLTPQPSSGLISASQRIVFYFNQHQFYVKVTSTISGPVLSGEGWYDDSALATFSASTPYVVSAEERYVFATWTGDIYSASSTVTLQMTRPLTVTATWTRQFLLRFQASGVPDGTGLTVRIAGQEGTFTTPGEVALWFDAGKEYALEAPVPFSFFASGSLYVFASWRNEAETAITTFQLNSPTTLVALYETSQGGVRLPIQWENQQGEALLFTDTNVLEFRYNPAWRAVTFTLEGSSSFILIVPKAMFLGDPVMLFDGQLVLPPDLGVTLDQSGSNYVISYSFPPGQRTFIVGGSQVIPEFPHIYLLAILFLSLALARFATHAKRKTAAAEAWRYVHSSP